MRRDANLIRRLTCVRLKTSSPRVTTVVAMPMAPVAALIGQLSTYYPSVNAHMRIALKQSRTVLCPLIRHDRSAKKVYLVS